MARPNPVVRAKLQKLAPDALAAIDPFAPSAMADPFASLDAFCKMQPKAEDETPCECKSKELEGGKLAAPFAGVALAEVLCRETDHSDNDHGWRFVVAKTSAVGPRAGSASTTTRCGARPEAALVITTTSGVLGLFYHWNVATPPWLGYLVQRPESHCIHHELDVHAYNHSELPLIRPAPRVSPMAPRCSGRSACSRTRACGFPAVVRARRRRGPPRRLHHVDRPALRQARPPRGLS